jgi:hypothetical protein
VSQVSLRRPTLMSPHADPDAPQVRAALGYGGRIETGLLFVTLVIAAAPIVVPAIHGRFRAGNLAPACALLIAGLVVFALLSRRRAARARAWLAALPFPFELPRYWALLGETNASRAITIELVLAQPVADPANFVAWLTDQPMIEQAGTTDATHFWFTGPIVSTQSGSNYTSGPLHRWFRDRAAPFLAKLHAESPLATTFVR